MVSNAWDQGAGPSIKVFVTSILNGSSLSRCLALCCLHHTAYSCLEQGLTAPARFPHVQEGVFATTGLLVTAGESTGGAAATAMQQVLSLMAAVAEGLAGTLVEEWSRGWHQAAAECLCKCWQVVGQQGTAMLYADR